MHRFRTFVYNPHPIPYSRDPIRKGNNALGRATASSVTRKAYRLQTSTGKSYPAACNLRFCWSGNTARLLLPIYLPHLYLHGHPRLHRTGVTGVRLVEALRKKPGCSCLVVVGTRHRPVLRSFSTVGHPSKVVLVFGRVDNALSY